MVNIINEITEDIFRKLRFLSPYDRKRPNPEHVITSFRNSDRDIEDIPKEEIILLFNRIIEAQQSVNREDLYRIFLEMNSGTTLLNSHVKNKLDYVLDYALSHKLLKDGFVEHYE